MNGFQSIVSPVDLFGLSAEASRLIVAQVLVAAQIVLRVTLETLVE